MDILFFGVVVDGFGHVLCSHCERELAENPEVDLVFIGPVHGSVSCAMCGLTPSDTEEEVLEKITRRHIR